MSSSTGCQRPRNAAEESVEMMPKLTSLGACAQAGRTITHKVSEAKNRLSHMKSLSRWIFVVGQKRNVIGQLEDLVGLGAVELAQQRRGQVRRRAVVDDPAVMQRHGARAVLEGDVHLVQ